MTIREAMIQATEQLANAGVPDPRTDCELMLAHIMQVNRMTLRMNMNENLTKEQEQRLASLLLSRAERKPLQYLMGEQYFYGLRFQVDKSVLIPRPETEELCEWGISFLKSKQSALDLCTGSGAIAVTLKHECPHAHVTASDLSEAALATARQNAALNGVEVQFLHGDLWEAVQDMTFDLILSNPPYIPTQDCNSLQAEVMHEPRMALDGGDDGLDFYRRIAEKAIEHLNPGGMIAVELGIGEAKAVAELFQKAGLINVQIRRDLEGVERMVGAMKEQNDV